MTEIQLNKNAALIHSSLEHIAERVTDLTPQVYARYFARHPEARVLFGHDDDDDLKGDMLSRLIMQIMDYAEGRANPEIIVSWASDHVAYGVSLAMFPAMFESLEETLSEAAGEAWTTEVSCAWQAQFDGLLALIEAAFRRFAPGNLAA